MSELETLLVVDDIADNRDILARRLRKKGYPVREAVDGESALAAIFAGGIDLVLLDVMMPGLSGIDVLKQVRRTHSESELPIIMVTAKSESDDVVEAISAGANDYVTKPIDFPALLARLEKELRARRRMLQSQDTLPALAPGEPTPGTVLAGRYRLDKSIGSGAFGTVFRGRHLDLDRAVAVKVLRAAVLGKGHVVARFRREGISACRVVHASATTIYDFGVSPEGVSYLVMELLEGRSLADEIDAYRIIPPRRATELMVPVCDVLATAHEAGIIHRDIKPPNIFLHRGPLGEVVKVCDFGIAKIAGDPAMEQITVEGGLVGTPAYMAPERLLGRSYDGRSDVYSVGVTMYKMLTGRHPWFALARDKEDLVQKQLNQPPPPLRDHNPAVPPLLESLVLSSLCKNPDERPTAAEFARALRRVLTVIPADGPLPEERIELAHTIPPPAPPPLPAEVSISMEFSGDEAATADERAPGPVSTRTLLSGGRRS